MVIKPRSGLVEGQMGSSDWRVHLVPKQGQRFQRVYGQGARHGMRAELQLLDLEKLFMFLFHLVPSAWLSFVRLLFDL